MRVEGDQIARFSNFMLQELGASPRLAGATWRVLSSGNEKHGEDEQVPHQHIEAALRHCRYTGADEETGEPHKAHVAARLILALIALAKGGSR